MMDKETVCIVIPIYKLPSALELISLEQCFKILSSYPVILVKPAALNVDDLRVSYPFHDIVSFASDYFSSIQGYNRLMLTAEFYNRFAAYELMLLHQLDVFVFRDELSFWCSQGYDYIGAPWFYKAPDFIKKIKDTLVQELYIKYNVKKNGLPSPIQFHNKVGNGGFSLRRINKFLAVCNDPAFPMAAYQTPVHNYFHEDVFWSIEVNRKGKRLNIPGSKTALQFSIEMFPALALQKNRGCLPFGCHAWDRYIDFWKPFIEQQGYVI